MQFRYLPPAPEEQRDFVMQLIGTVLGIVVIAVLLRRTHDGATAGVLWGSGIAVVYMLARPAWRLEKKAQRSQQGLIEIDENGLQLTNGDGKTQSVTWDELEKYDLIGGRIVLGWKDGSLTIGARELENGMTFARAIQEHRQGSAPAAKPSNFIPLEPR